MTWRYAMHDPSVNSLAVYAGDALIGVEHEDTAGQRFIYWDGEGWLDGRSRQVVGPAVQVVAEGEPC